MTKIVFKYNFLYKNSIPIINDIISDLNNLKNFIDNMYVPVDFSYYNYLKSINLKISSAINDYEMLINKINSTNTELMSVLTTINDNISNVNVSLLSSNDITKS